MCWFFIALSRFVGRCCYLIIRPVDVWIDRRHSFQMLCRDHLEHPKIATEIMYATRPGFPLLSAAWNAIVPSLLARSGAKVYRLFGPGVLRDLMVSQPSLTLGLHVVSEVSICDSLQVWSSSSVLPVEQHWTKCQEREFLYTSGE